MISIVAVHGLGANPRSAWTYKPNSPPNSSYWFGRSSHLGACSEEAAHWLKDFLPEKIPCARIFCFEYESKWLGCGLPEPSLPALGEGLLEALKQEVWLPDYKAMYIETAHSRA